MTPSVHHHLWMRIGSWMLPILRCPVWAAASWAQGIKRRLGPRKAEKSDGQVFVAIYAKRGRSYGYADSRSKAKPVQHTVPLLPRRGREGYGVPRCPSVAGAVPGQRVQ